MTATPLIARHLVPSVAPAVPDGFERLPTALVAGLPHSIALAQDLTLLLVVPTGLATRWRDADPAAVVTASDPEPAAGPAGRAPARLLLRGSDGVLASVPLVAGLRRTLPDGQARVELLILGWEIRAGSLRDPGDVGSRIELAWRPADRAGDTFSPPPISSRVLERLAAADQRKGRR